MSSIASNAPRLAVVIPTYNRAKLLARAVDSVLSAPFDDIELVVVDDASTDDTLDVLARYQDPRLIVRRLSRHSNGNVARNAGVRATRAPIVAFLDSDDEFLPGRIERLIDYFDRHPHIGAVMDSFRTELRGVASPAAIPNRIVDEATLVHLLVTHAIPLTTSALCVRREAIEQVGGFDEALARQQDRDILLRLARVTPVALGTGEDVLKHQVAASVSRGIAGYVEGLDHLVGRHAVFGQTQYRDILAYLAVRSCLKCIFSGRIGTAFAEARALMRAQNIPVSLGSAFSRYMQGKRLRRAATRSLCFLVASFTYLFFGMAQSASLMNGAIDLTT